jgi:hypothetical protein
MPRKPSDPHLKDQDLYEDLRDQGDSKQKAARQGRHCRNCRQ